MSTQPTPQPKPTPLTDAAIYTEDTGHNGLVEVVSPDFARTLERQLAGAINHNTYVHSQLAAAEARCGALEKALRGLISYPTHASVWERARSVLAQKPTHENH